MNTMDFIKYIKYVSFYFELIGYIGIWFPELIAVLEIPTMDKIA